MHNPSSSVLGNKVLESTVLIVEDDQDIAHLVELHLRDAGYSVDTAHDGRAGLEQATAQDYDLVILDLSLPGIEGLEVCRSLRARPRYPLILMLTARSSEVDRVLGLEIGADDYLTKPFGIRELLARARALFRRVEALGTAAACAVGEQQDTLRRGALVIDPTSREVAAEGKTLSLTAREFDLLLLLARHPGRVYTRAQLLDLVWGLSYEGYEHTVNSHINRLRAKIEKNPAQPRFLLTAWGVGYKFAAHGSEDTSD